MAVVDRRHMREPSGEIGEPISLAECKNHCLDMGMNDWITGSLERVGWLRPPSPYPSHEDEEDWRFMVLT